jgi:hypothetical protein
MVQNDALDMMETCISLIKLGWTRKNNLCSVAHPNNLPVL